MSDSKMYVFGAPDKVGSAGSSVQSSENKPSSEGTLIYFSCEDVATEAGLIEKAGGNRIGLHSNKQ